MVMKIQMKMKVRSNSKGRGPFQPGKKWMKSNSEVAALFANKTLEIMRSLTPVDTGLTRDTTVIVEGNPKVQRLGKSGGAKTFGANPTTISSFGPDKDFGTVGRLDINKQVTVQPMTEYARYVNEGTRRIAPRRWIEETEVKSNREIKKLAIYLYGEWEGSWNWKGPNVGRN